MILTLTKLPRPPSPSRSGPKGKRRRQKQREEALDEGNEETIDARLTADDMPAVNERLKNIEEHFALRYGECILSIPTM